MTFDRFLFSGWLDYDNENGAAGQRAVKRHRQKNSA
jgi:hypothetical protein